MKEYKYGSKTFQLNDSEGCYVTVTYERLTGYVGVNLGLFGEKPTSENPYVWYIDKKYVTPDGLKLGNSNGASFKENLDALCAELLRKFRTEEASKVFDSAKYCEKLHDAVKNLP